MLGRWVPRTKQSPDFRWGEPVCNGEGEERALVVWAPHFFVRFTHLHYDIVLGTTFASARKLLFNLQGDPSAAQHLSGSDSLPPPAEAINITTVLQCHFHQTEAALLRFERHVLQPANSAFWRPLCGSQHLEQLLVSNNVFVPTLEG